MRRGILASLIVGLLLVTLAAPALAGNAHFVGNTSTSTSGNTLTVSGKIAGLGNETQVHVEITVDARCVNRGGNKPSAGNKQSFGAAGDFPVQNGKANYTLEVTATFTPDCSPPMTVEWTNLLVSDTEHDIFQSFAGPL